MFFWPLTGDYIPAGDWEESSYYTLGIQTEIGMIEQLLFLNNIFFAPVKESYISCLYKKGKRRNVV